MTKKSATKNAPYVLPKERRKNAIASVAEMLSREIDIDAVRRELTVPWPRPEVADRTFLRAQKAITVLLAENERYRAVLTEYAKSDIYGARAREALGQ